MFSSTNESIGFSAIEQEELESVNGGGIGMTLFVGAGAIIAGTAIVIAVNGPPKK